MITPKFNCSQTETSVIVNLYTPAIRASDVEIHVEECLLSVHVNPYFLRLHFPGPVVEDDASSARYDAGTGYLTVTLAKVNQGEDFKDLDILASLLAPPRSEPSTSRPVIEVIGGEEAGEESLTKDEREILEAAENDWHLPQHPADDESIHIATRHYYGFLDMYTGYFNHVSHTENEVNELGADVEKLTPRERRERRIKHENEKWDEDHYMADFADDDMIQELISYRFSSESPFSRSSSPIAFTEEEDLIMLRLPTKEYLTTHLQAHNIYLTLMTLLASYAYESRTTQNDPTPESAWTICSLTPAFSALDPPPYPTSPPVISPSHSNEFTSSELQSTLIPFIRRAIAFPLYRNFALAKQCIRDVSNALCRGKRGVLRALLGLKDILDGHEVYYIYSKIWVDDMCSWVSRSASESKLQEVGELLNNLEIEKDAIEWDLQALEDVTRNASNRAPDSDDEDEDSSTRSISESETDSISPPTSSSSSSTTLSSSISSDAGTV
ncbi:SHQ1-domain-containing protein [Schizopora paradoxa]|uniref:SHQ1-domain-containing protein n=1 Tax=Schizopora paradoxa TaxID=27342 RepID=A0A0H2S109_9AGAM|nr:SHQ1-domain-containing protein [Schizopora paradoxa]